MTFFEYFTIDAIVKIIAIYILTNIKFVANAYTYIDIDIEIRYKLNIAIAYILNLLEMLNCIIATWNIDKENQLYNSYRNKLANLLKLNIITNLSIDTTF